MCGDTFLLFSDWFPFPLFPVPFPFLDTLPYLTSYFLLDGLFSLLLYFLLGSTAVSFVATLFFSCFFFFSLFFWTFEAERHKKGGRCSSAERTYCICR